VPYSSKSTVVLFREYYFLSLYIGERIAQSSYIIAYKDNKSTLNLSNIERKVIQYLCSSAGLLQIRFCNKDRQKLTINIPYYS
jgi:hypothetical protein